MKSILPGMFKDEDFEVRKTIPLYWKVSKRYFWDLSCETDPQTSSLNFYQTLEKLANYFDKEPQKLFVSLLGKPLDATSTESISLFNALDDRGVNPKIASQHIQTFQGLLVLYLLCLSMTMICHIAGTPRIEESKSALRCKRVKWILIWTPILLIVLAA